MSFELAAKRLGADVLSLNPSISSTAKGESLIDTIKNLSSMQNSFFVVRHFNSGAAQFIAKNTSAHVLNAGDGCNEHPSQAMLDIFTILEHLDGVNFKDLSPIKGAKISIIGDIFIRALLDQIFMLCKALALILRCLARLLACAMLACLNAKSLKT